MAEDRGQANAAAWLETITELVARLDAAKDDDTAREAVAQEVHAGPLSVMVRDGWRLAGAASEGAEEYEILLITGGPALRIVGQLNQYDEPETAELQYQDWGTPWTHYPCTEATLLAYARQFYFGD